MILLPGTEFARTRYIQGHIQTEDCHGDYHGDMLRVQAMSKIALLAE